MDTNQRSRYADLDPAPRLLLGPGPSMVHPRVLRAMGTPLIGHLDPQFITLMNETQELLRLVFETTNALTLPISGTGSAGMEAALCNFIEPGDPILICVSGYFGERMIDMASRYGADVQRIDVPWGGVFSAQQIEQALDAHRAKVVAIVHGETSTGTLQPLEEIAEVVHRHGALFLVDAVTSLGGVRVGVDAIGIDICYSGSQKCLGCPPGLAPLTINPRAEDVLRARRSRVANWYLDLTMVQKYWGGDRTYHHTAPISMNYALREGLRVIEEEGLPARYERHQRHAQLLWEGLAEMGLSLHVQVPYRLPSLTTVRVPEGVDELAVRRQLLDDYNIEIAGGLGALKGKVWRVGLMGYGSRPENVVTLLGALERIL
jgi:alanine-glyoxylate transaminase/serine-glyoxylate transaminase/serine-pyruvate transaminase